MTFEQNTEADQNARSEWQAPELVELQAASITEISSGPAIADGMFNS